MTKVVHLSSVHPAQDTRILHRECRSLVEAGFEVVLIANSDHDFLQHGVRVRGLGEAPSSRLVRMTRQVARVYRMAREERGDIYHFHDPELIPIGVLLRLQGKPVVYDVHESVSKLIQTKYWLPKAIRSLVAGAYRLLERAVSPVFSAFVVATPGIAEYFPNRKTVVVQNFPVISELEYQGERKPAREDGLVVYVGGLTLERGLKEMMAAMAALPAEANVRLHLGGLYAPKSLEADATHFPGADRTTTLGRLDRVQVADLLAHASVGLVTLHPVPNHLDSYPVKLFEYMAAGLPIVASDFPFWQQFVDDVGTGVMVDPMNPQAIADGILEIVNDPERARAMSEAGVRAVRERFNWDSEAEKLVTLVERLAGGKGDAVGFGS